MRRPVFVTDLTGFTKNPALAGAVPKAAVANTIEFDIPCIVTLTAPSALIMIEFAGCEPVVAFDPAVDPIAPSLWPEFPAFDPIAIALSCWPVRPALDPMAIALSFWPLLPAFDPIATAPAICFVVPAPAPTPISNGWE